MGQGVPPAQPGQAQGPGEVVAGAARQQRELQSPGHQRGQELMHGAVAAGHQHAAALGQGLQALAGAVDVVGQHERHLRQGLAQRGGKGGAAAIGGMRVQQAERGGRGVRQGGYGHPAIEAGAAGSRHRRRPWRMAAATCLDWPAETLVVPCPRW